MDEELLAKTRKAIEARLNSLAEQRVVQYNLVVPLTAEQMERLLNALEGK